MFLISKAKPSLNGKVLFLLFINETVYFLNYVFLAALPTVNQNITDCGETLVVKGSFNLYMLVWSLLVLLLYAVYLFFKSSLSNYIAYKIEHRIKKAVKGSFFSKLSKIDLSHYNSSRLYDRIAYIGEKIPDITENFFTGGMFVTLIGTLFSVVYIAVSVMFSSVVCGCLVLGSNLILVYGYIYEVNHDYYTDVENIPEKRWEGVYSELIEKRENIRESRARGIVPYLTEKWETIEKKLIKKQMRLTFRYSFIHTVSAVIRYFMIGISLVISVKMIISGKAGVGLFMLVYSSQVVLEGKVSRIIYSIFAIGNTVRDIDVWKEIDSLEECFADDSESVSRLDITISDLTYRYENSDKNAVNGVSLHIRQGEKIAVVGDNGSGKTTLIMLLLGLLRPCSGSIDVEGIAGGAKCVRKNCAVLFQDFGKYEMSLEENVRIGDVSAPNDRNRLLKAEQRAGVQQIIAKLAHGGDTNLGTLNDSAVDLSGGEWQRVALARLFYKEDARLLIMDEPTAALDPISEAQIYNEVLSTEEKRSLIMISHRLGATRFMDRIIVMDHGRIVEEGNHEELIAINGLYCKMYKAQANWYQK